MAGIGDLSLADKLYSEVEEFEKSSGVSTKKKSQNQNVVEKSKGSAHHEVGSSYFKKDPNNFQNNRRGRRGHSNGRGARSRNQSLPRPLLSYEMSGRMASTSKYVPTNEGNTRFHPNAFQHPTTNIRFQESNGNQNGGRGRTGSRGRGRGKFDSGGMSRSSSIQSLTSEALINMRRGPKKMGYKRLEDLIKQPPFDIVTNLVNPQYGFQELLSSTLRPDILILVVKALSKACESEFEVNKGALLSMVCQSELLNSIQYYLANMPSDEDNKRRLTVSEFTSDLLKLFEIIMRKLPNTASEKLKNIFITTDMAIDGLKRYRNIELVEQKNTLEKLLIKLNNMIQDREYKKNKNDSKNELMRYNRPPDDFREKSLYPTLEDLFGEKKPFVRPNIIEGAYEDVEDYLDIQFRLLREDFIAPLREGLETYLSFTDPKKKIKVDNVRIFKNVFFGDPKIVKDSIGITVYFDPQKKMNIRWEYSKRFMFGSLLIFTNDNFKTFVIGTVLDRDEKDLKAGIITVALHENDCQNFFGTAFLMLESEIYFEPYKQVMKALQGLDESNFPMKKYIVDVESDSSPPKYLLNFPDYVYNVEGFKIQVLNEVSWPNANELELDESQLAAFKAALTQEFVVIQGPPGTGKTFLGLKIAKALLKNSNIWKNSNSARLYRNDLQEDDLEIDDLEEDLELDGDKTQLNPILVVCYTNHALDQFLEGIVPVTKKIVRLGGQSKSTLMEQFNLRQQRRNFRYSSFNYHLKGKLYSELNQHMRLIQLHQSNLEELNKNGGILSLGTLNSRTNIIKQEHLACFKSQFDSGDEMLCKWLQEASNTMDLSLGEEDGGVLDVNQNDENVFLFDDLPEAIKTRDFDYEEFDLGNIAHDVQYALNLKDIISEKNKLGSKIQAKENSNDLSNLRNLNYHYQYLDYWSQTWTTLLRRKRQASQATIEELLSCHNLWRLQPEERWILYFEWVNRLKFSWRNEVLGLRRTYSDLAKRHEEMKQLCDLEIMRDSLVVGMTTTNAARVQDLLRTLNPKIVIVEEAAEVLESHIVVSLTNKCEHVILIGDHQQLRPAPAVFRLAKQFHLDVSLFERMVKNGLPCYSLENQHRMRPEISALIKPTIYPNLQNDPCVYSYPPVRGVTKSLFFVSHTVPEEEVEDISSRRNCHEADFLLALCRYLLLQGYSPEEITILATYKGQMFYLKKKQKTNSILADVHITVVDNYQGEENKIILLSLVRSNEENKIGFLKTENRVCVALSRAKQGLYIIGNMDSLTQSSTIWPKIKDSLEKQQAFGSHLTLQCSVHPEQQTPVSCSDDLKNVPEGGCLLPCLATLPCGHQCDSICHANNREHKEYKCLKSCERSPVECPLDHPCPKLCFEDCGSCRVKMDRVLPCGHQKQLPCYVNYKEYQCRETVEVELPLCGHKVQKPCFSDLASFPCPEPCPDRLSCGHCCISNCHADKDPDHLEYICQKPCTRKNLQCTLNHECAKKCYEECGLCVFEVTKNLPNCKHSLKMKCFEDPGTAECKKKCEKTMECGHTCPRLCFEPCGGCQKKVEKVIPPCNHKAKMKCCETPTKDKCRKPCEEMLACGHACNRSCGQSCQDKCCVEVKCPVALLCGHSLNIPCYRSTNVDPASEEFLALCQMPCGKILECGHNCKGSCGECMQGRIHAPCKEKCGRSLICGHKCRVACAKSCPPCLAKCRYSCKHSRCNRKCGVPCAPCKERCGRGCVHQRCSKYCFELCDVQPCQKPCPKKLKCGHSCIGFCGDKCPPLCKICDKDQLTEFILSGREDEEDARFVYLVDCKHTIEAEGLEYWLHQDDNEITLKTCPKCKSNILHTERYMNYVKTNLENVSKVKTKVFGEWNLLKSERKRLRKAFLSQDGDTLRYVVMHSSKFQELFILCENDLQSTYHTSRGNRQNFLSSQDLTNLNSEIEILNDLVSTIHLTIIQPKVVLKEGIREKMFSKFDLLLKKIKDCHKQLGRQETSDVNQECKRFLRIAQLAVVESSGNFEPCLQNTVFKTSYEKAHKIIHGICIYSDKDHEELKVIVASLRKSVGSSQLTERERKEIVQAVGVKQGAWFKCPNGHIYCIGECGGAMQVAKCPECGAQIGGTNHSLLRSNTLATEMDGARRAAWPNMH